MWKTARGASPFFFVFFGSPQVCWVVLALETSCLGRKKKLLKLSAIRVVELHELHEII